MSSDEQLTWISVLRFLEKEYTQTNMREREWSYERQLLTSRITALQAELRSNTLVCEDLLGRIALLEAALKDQKAKRSNGKSLLEKQEVAALVQKMTESQAEQCSHEEFLREITKDLKFLQQEPARLILDLKEDKLVFPSQGKLTERKKIGAHLDVITAMVPLQNSGEPLFATASEDCLVKVWNLSSALRQDCQPRHTLRKHTGPLFSLAAGPNPQNEAETLLFSAGIEGDIKSWRVEKGTAEWTGSWPNGSQEEQPIWQLHMREDKLLSASSDGVVRLFKVKTGPKMEVVLTKEFKEKQFNHAAAKFVSSHSFLASCNNAPRIHLWEVQGRLCQKYLYESDKGKEFSLVQANRVDAHNDLKIVLAACQDGFLRCFDYSSARPLKKLQAPASLTSLLAYDWTIAAGDHKGALHLWDSRTFKLLESRGELHLQKYQTGVTSLCRLQNHTLSAGADGIVKILS